MLQKKYVFKTFNFTKSRNTFALQNIFSVANSKKKPDPNRSEANKYDKIIKENLIRAVPGLMLIFAGLVITGMRPVNVELQKTKEAKADFIAIITDDTGRELVLHIEFQVENDSKMRYRMFEYKGFLIRQYERAQVLQYVIFLGENPPTMETHLSDADLSFRFHLDWLRDINYRELLKTETPELIILALLADFETAPPELVAEQVFEKLKEFAETELEFQRFTNQLRVISNLRNLQPLIDNLMLKISKYFVEERDPLFKKGIEQGIEQGIELGQIEGMTQAKLDIVVNLINKSDHDNFFIAEISGLDISVVKEIRDLVQKYPDNFRSKLKDIRILPE